MSPSMVSQPGSDARLLFFGDSITDTHHLEDPEQLGSGYVREIATALAAPAPEGGTAQVLNRGVSGNRIGDLLERRDADCLELAPDMVTILIGINDVARRYNAAQEPTAHDVFAARYRTLLASIRESLPSARLVLMTPFLLDVDEERARYREDLEPKAEIVRRLAAEVGAVLVDVKARIDELVVNGMPPVELADDGIHPTPYGHRVLAECWLRAVLDKSAGLSDGTSSAGDADARARLEVTLEPQPAPRNELAPQPVTVCRMGEDGPHVTARALRIPALARLDETTLLAVLDSRPTLVDLPSSIDVVGALSRDRGDTWGPLFPIRTSEDGTGVRGFGDPCVIVDGDRLHVLYAESATVGFLESGDGIEEDDPSVQQTSSSSIALAELLAAPADGPPPSAWSHRNHTRAIRTSIAQVLESQGLERRAAGLFVSSGHGIRLEHSKAAGRLLTGAVVRLGEENRVSVLASDDCGATWRTTAVMPAGGDESAITELSDGRVMLHAREVGARLQAISTDGGENFGPWQTQQELTDPGCNGDLLAVGDVLIASHCADPGSRRNVSLTRSDDAGRSWPLRRALDTGSSAYSALADLGDGEIGVLWEADGYRSLRFQRVAIDAVTAPHAEEDVHAQEQPEVEISVRHVALGARPDDPADLPAPRDVRLSPVSAGMISLLPDNRAHFAREQLESSFGPSRSRCGAGDVLTVDVHVSLPASGVLTVSVAGRSVVREEVPAGRHVLPVPIHLTVADLAGVDGALEVTAAVKLS